MNHVPFLGFFGFQCILFKTWCLYLMRRYYTSMAGLTTNISNYQDIQHTHKICTLLSKMRQAYTIYNTSCKTTYSIPFSDKRNNHFWASLAVLWKKNFFATIDFEINYLACLERSHHVFAYHSTATGLFWWEVPVWHFSPELSCK